MTEREHDFLKEVILEQLRQLRRCDRAVQPDDEEDYVNDVFVELLSSPDLKEMHNRLVDLIRKFANRVTNRNRHSIALPEEEYVQRPQLKTNRGKRPREHLRGRTGPQLRRLFSLRQANYAAGSLFVLGSANRLLFLLRRKTRQNAKGKNRKQQDKGLAGVVNNYRDPGPAENIPSPGGFPFGICSACLRCFSARWLARNTTRPRHKHRSGSRCRHRLTVLVERTFCGIWTVGLAP